MTSDKENGRVENRISRAIRIAEASLLFLLKNVFALLLVVCIVMGGVWTWIGLFAFILCILLLDQALGNVSGNEIALSTWYYQLQLYLALPLLVIATLVALNSTGSVPVPILDDSLKALQIDTDYVRNSRRGVDMIAVFVSVGIIYALVGINVAHELCHRLHSRSSMILGRWLLAFSGDTSFAIEHVYGHHKNVATDRDPATARRGEAAFSFVLRSTIGQIKSAYALEKDRLSRIPGRSNLIYNRFWRGQLMTLCIILIYVAFLGFVQGAAMFLLSALVSKFILEITNYIEHYGLVRIPGSAVESRHSWDCYRRVSCALFFNLPLHADHHRFALRPFWQLKQQQEAKLVMPLGYSAMFFAALLPGVWKKLVHPLLAEWDRNLASDREIEYLSSENLLLGPRE